MLNRLQFGQHLAAASVMTSLCPLMELAAAETTTSSTQPRKKIAFPGTTFSNTRTRSIFWIASRWDMQWAVSGIRRESTWHRSM